MANGDGPLTAIRLRASDGVLSQPPNDAMNTNQEHVFYVPVNRDSGYDNRYRKIMGDKLGQTLQLQLTRKSPQVVPSFSRVACSNNPFQQRERARSSWRSGR